MEGESLFHKLHARIDEEFENSEPTSDDVKEVFARFGLAYYHAEVLYRGLCNLYSASQVPPLGPITRHRLEEHIRTAFEMTLGQLLPRLQPILPPPLFDRLNVALERRNFIAHRFWYERSHLMTSLSGIDSMVAELSQDTELFQQLDREVEKISEPFHARVGLTSELFSMAFDDITSGNAEASEPLHAQRKPRKQETVVNVFNVPAEPGYTTLVFETDDSLLWQLCDSGLGWSHYERVDQTWPKIPKFARLLPAKIDPRPKASAPWTFEIRFGAHAVLAVYLGKQSGQVIYDLRVQSKQARAESH